MQYHVRLNSSLSMISNKSGKRFSGFWILSVSKWASFFALMKRWFESLAMEEQSKPTDEEDCSGVSLKTDYEYLGKFSSLVTIQ